MFRSVQRKIYIDIEAHQQRNGIRRRILLAEVKCFPDRESRTVDLYTAIGQYLVYRSMLVYAGIDAALYLALPQDVYTEIFDAPIQSVCAEHRIALILIDVAQEMVVRWIE